MPKPVLPGPWTTARRRLGPASGAGAGRYRHVTLAMLAHATCPSRRRPPKPGCGLIPVTLGEVRRLLAHLIPPSPPALPPGPGPPGEDITSTRPGSASKSTRAWLEDHPRIRHAFIPKRACWLNLQEGWWRIFRRQALAGQDFAGPDEIAHATRVATAQLNARARPGVWGRPEPEHRSYRRRFSLSSSFTVSLPPGNQLPTAVRSVGNRDIGVCRVRAKRGDYGGP